MLERIGNFAVRRRVLVLVVAALAFGLAGAVGGGVAERLTAGGFDDPAAESVRAAEILEEQFGAGDANLVLLVSAAGGNVDDPAVVAAGRALTAELAAEHGVASVSSYWSLGSPPPLKSRRGDSALVLARLGGTEDEIDERVAEISPKYTRADGVIGVRVGGQAEVFRQVGAQIEEDLVRAEVILLPITVALLVFIFGSVVAALLPLAVGALAVVGTFLVLRLLSEATDVSIYALNLTTAMGLGLAIDYSLFIVSRFREELRAGLSTTDAVVRTVRTAGRTVAFSSLTVAVSLSTLLVFPLAFLRSFAYAGAAVVALACVGAVVVLPALLAVLGPRVDKWVLFRRRAPHEVGEGFWHRVAVAVMRRPLPVALGVVALLLVLGSPFLGIRFGLPDDRVLPAGLSSRQVSQTLRSDYASKEAGAMPVVAPTLGDPTRHTAEIDRYAQAVSAVGGVARVDALTGSYAGGRRVAPPNPGSRRFHGETGTWLSVVPAVEPVSLAGERVVTSVRTVDAPFRTLVGGPSASLVDSKESIFGRVPLAGVLIALTTFVVLFLAFGSLLVPAKAVLLNLLSLTATFGAMVWIFQDGHLSDLLSFTATGTLNVTVPLLMFCIAFGLSMDYEVFLLSRIKEEHDRSGDNKASVAAGLERTGRIVTAAALLIAIVFAAFGTSGISFMKLFGIGLTLAVLLDATLVRGALVPSFMALAGEANWWAPAPLRRVYERFGISESEPSEPSNVPARQRPDPTMVR